ncbi:hypothetical protein BO78DRAFT_435822 [Aspergillus sclerotiicarbonarius CBS 121057]|uniref:NACHT domain-containing protein n=1 Tax=Aspergillus sclerotiicarbonarius (strain CBS 121057 / IBT 28362) TaxID=1448318 RepID=A0A319E4R1_ASPSB|nr:hypothetical protein BO78DRAFT_435822 [Aspergillus sclerotiicarbonarius CBS 121057]
MAEDIYHPSRPTSTDGLVDRLKITSSTKERKALEALVSRMVELFKDHQKESFIIEASLISNVASKQDCRDLVFAFSRAIITGTADENIVNTTLLMSFASCLRHMKFKIPKEIAQFASVLRSLSKQLTNATSGRQPQDQYYLICTIGNILDAMVDMEFSGIDREELHKPLLDKLHDLEKSDEPRTSQAARYAHQALLKVPDNESPWGAFYRISWTIIKATTKAASAVSSMDPDKFLEAAPDLKSILELFKEIGDTANQLYNLSKDGKDALLEGMDYVSKTQGWYAALRYTDMLIKARAFNMLNSLLGQSLCVEEEPFFCGFYAQLEQAWCGDELARHDIENLIQSTLSKSQNYKQASKWINILAATTGHREWEIQQKKSRFFKFNLHRKSRQSGINLDMFNGNLPITETPRHLLDDAWASCQQAKLFYADLVIDKYYKEKGRLDIVRLSEDLLPMEKCYVNLAIIESSTASNTEFSNLQIESQQVSEFSITRRLKVDDAGTEKAVDLPQLFNERQVNNRTIVPRRILIRGRAGVGKTTLCKKIVHDFINGKIWTKRFDRILWIPLRHLRTQPDPEDFIYKEFLSEQQEPRVYYEVLHDAIWTEREDSKTLFLLDGLDEVSRDRTERGVGLPTQIERLLNRPNVLVTSRPYGLDMLGVNKFDLEMETVGFRPEQVRAYLSMVVTDQSNAEEMATFVQEHWLIQGLIQIPIHLDAFSVTWGGMKPDQSIQSMTTLYTAIEHKLWVKDIPRIHHDVSAAKVQNIRGWRKLETYVKEECEFLELLAFTGLYNDMAEFSPGHRDEIYERLPSNNVDDNILENLSFLRAMDSSDPRDKEYYFIHLTFQEFFAARYFVRCWSQGKELTCITLGGVTKFEGVDKFIAREKYNGRLLMHCLSELTSSTHESGLQNTRLKTALQLTRLLLLEAQIKRSRPVLGHHSLYAASVALSLGTAMEFSEWILQNLLEKGTNMHRQTALEVLAWRPRVSATTFEQARSILDGGDCDELKAEAALIVGKEPHRSPKTTIKAIQSESEVIRSGVFDGLKKNSMLRQDILQALLSHSKIDGLAVIANQSELPLAIFDGIVCQLNDPYDVIRMYSIDILKKYLPLNRDVFNSVVNLLDDIEYEVRTTAAGALLQDTNLPPSCVESLMSRLESDISQMTPYVVTLAYVLKRQEFLPERILDRIKTLKHSTLSDEDILALFRRAKFPDDIAIEVTQSMFVRQEHPPRDILNHCVSLFDYGGLLSIHAINAVGTNPELPEEILDRLFLLLASPDRGVRDSVLRAFAAQHMPPSQFLQFIKPYMEELVSENCISLFQLLRKYPPLPDNSLEILVRHCLNGACLWCGGRLSWLQAFPESMIRPVALRLRIESKSAQIWGEETLLKHSKFYSILEELDTECWVSWLKILFEGSFTEGVICFIQDEYLCVEIPEGSFEVNIGSPGQREKLGAALDAIHQDIEDCLDGFELSGLPSEENVLVS